MSSRKQYNSRFKAQVALEAIKNQRTIGEIASEFSIHPSQIHKWKKHILCFGYRVALMNCPISSLILIFRLFLIKFRKLRKTDFCF